MSRKFNNDVGQKQMRSAHCKATETDMMVSRDIRSNTVAESETLGQTETEQMQNTESGGTSFMAEERNEGTEGRTEENAEGNTQERRPQRRYTVSEISSPDGAGKFYQDENGSIDLVFPRENALAAIGLSRIPFRMTTNIAAHIYNYHRIELGLRSYKQAVAFAVNVMENFDHIRKGDDEGSYIFSIENGRRTVGKRTIGIEVETDGEHFLRAKTAGYENMERLRQREQLWEEGAENSISSTDAASANVTTETSQQGGEMSSSASNQSASLSEGKGSENSVTSKESAENSRFSAEERRVAVTDKLMHDLRAFWQQ